MLWGRKQIPNHPVYTRIIRYDYNIRKYTTRIIKIGGDDDRIQTDRYVVTCMYVTVAAAAATRQVLTARERERE